MRIAFAALLVSLALFPGLAFADPFDDCVDKAWEDYFECSADCAADLKCQSKCSAKKVKDLKTCNSKGVKRQRSASGKLESLLLKSASASSSKCAKNFRKSKLNNNSSRLSNNCQRNK